MRSDDKLVVGLFEKALNLDHWEKRAANYWRRNAGWPVDGPGWTFVGRALNAIGQARFGALWTGNELYERFMPFLDDPLPLLGISFDAEYAISILAAFDIPADLDGPCLSRREAQIAVDLFEKHLRRTRVASSERMSAVLNTCVAALAQGRIRSAARPIRGAGSFQQLPLGVWNSDDAWPRFTMGLIDPASPGDAWPETPDAIKWLLDDPALRHTWPSYIFVNQDDVAQLSAEITTSAVAAKKPPPDVEVGQPSDATAALPVAINEEAGGAGELQSKGSGPPAKFSQTKANDEAERFIAEAVGGKRPQPTLEEFVAHLTDAVPGLNKSNARILWREKRPAAWSKPGPRGPKSRQQSRE